MKSLLRLLQKFKSCPKAQELAFALLGQVAPLSTFVSTFLTPPATLAKQCVARFNQEIYFTQLVGLVGEIIKIVSATLPHII
jgi:hypothetical protein